MSRLEELADEAGLDYMDLRDYLEREVERRLKGKGVRTPFGNAAAGRDDRPEA